VVDVSDPANPVEVAALENSVLQGTAERVVLGDAPPGRSGQAYAYLTVREGGLRTLDITDPVHPHPVGAYTPPAGAIRGVAVARRYAYAWGTTEGRQGKEVMYVIDLADPTRPDLVASVELPDQTSSDVPLEAWSSDVALAGDYAYVTMAISDFGYRRSSGSLHVIDVSDPTQPWLVSSLDVPDEVFAMVVSDGAAGGGRYGYLAAKNEGLWVVDVSDPIQPQLVGLADTPDCARDITVVDDLVYVADGDGGLLILRAMEDS
jgi:hypothetical protein